MITINTIAGDDTINASEQGAVITGTNLAGASVGLRIGANTRAATVTGTTWRYTLVAADITAMGQGAETISATLTVAGKVSQAATRNITVDTAPPSSPTINVIAGNDNISASEQGAVITGTNQAGATVMLTLAGTPRAATVNGTTWSYTLVPRDIADMGQGGETISVTQTDAAGNVSQAASRNITVDAVVAGVPVINTIAGNDIINASEQSTTITGTNQAGASVALRIGGNTRTATVTGTNWRYTLVAADIAAMGQGAENITATQTVAGKVSQASARWIWVDTAPPSPPTINVIAGDNAINASEQGAVITGTNWDGMSVALTIGGNTRAATVNGTNWSYTLVAADIAAMGQGAETISVTQTDFSGNVSRAATRGIWVDTAPPSPPTINVIAGDNTIHASEQGAVITGTNWAGTLVALTIGGNTRAATVNGTNWSYTLVAADIAAMGLGAETISVTQTDWAGNVSRAATRNIWVNDTDFNAMLDALRAFESGIDTNNLNTYIAKYNDPNALTYTEMTTIGNVRYPVFDQNGNRKRIPMSYKQYFETLDVGNHFNPKTATAETVKKMQFGSTNDLNFVGYQVGEAALIQAGYYVPPTDPKTGLSKYYIWTDTVWKTGELERQVTLPWGTEIILTRVNTWAGTFTGKNGIRSLADVKTELGGQMIIQDVWEANYHSISKAITAAGKNWSDVLNQSFTETMNGQVVNVKLSMSGVIAAAHLVGAGAVSNLLISGTIVKDENGTSPLKYIHEFGQNATPWGTNGNDILSGNEYANTIYTNGGNDVVTLGGGRDTVVMGKGLQKLTIKDYLVGEDRLLVTGITKEQWNEGLTVSDTTNGIVVALSDKSTINFNGNFTGATKTAQGLNIFHKDDYQLSWYGTASKSVNDFEIGVDAIVAPQGGDYKFLKVSKVADSWEWMDQSRNINGATTTSFKFSTIGDGSGGGVSISNLKKEEVESNLTKITQDFTGDVSKVSLNLTDTEVDLRNAYGVNLKGTNESEIFKNVGNQGNGAAGLGGSTIYGNGGRDTFVISDSSISWFGKKEITIADFVLDWNSSERDVLDLRALSNKDFRILAVSSGNDNGTDLIISRLSDLTMSNVIHLNGVNHSYLNDIFIQGGNSQVILA